MLFSSTTFSANSKKFLEKCQAYIELSELYNWERIECVKNNELRTIDDISDEIYNIIKKYLEK